MHNFFVHVLVFRTHEDDEENNLASALPVWIVAAFVVSALAIGSISVRAADRKGAYVTQAIGNVRLLTSGAGTRSASVGDNAPKGTAVRSGSNSRAELTFSDRTIVRLGADTAFSLGAQEFDLVDGTMLLYAPKNSGGAIINTKLATVAGTGFTAMAEYRPGAGLNFIVLEGRSTVALKPHPGKTVVLNAGQTIVVRAGAAELPQPHDVDLSSLIKNSLLITGFRPLPNLDRILAEAQKQQNLAPTFPLKDPTGMNVRDQRAAARPR